MSFAGPLTRADLLSLEDYAAQRPAFRARVMAHKAGRRLALGPHVALHFEDKLTMQYQVQEMLRIERIFEAAGIADELAVYAPLVPDGNNWKATLMIEYHDVAERQAALARLVGIETRIWLAVAGQPPVFPIADEDLPRSTSEKTAAVHFLRFELPPAMIAAVKDGAALTAGIDHPQMALTVAVPPVVRDALAADLQ